MTLMTFTTCPVLNHVAPFGTMLQCFRWRLEGTPPKMSGPFAQWHTRNNWNSALASRTVVLDSHGLGRTGNSVHQWLPSIAMASPRTALQRVLKATCTTTARQVDDNWTTGSSFPCRSRVTGKAFPDVTSPRRERRNVSPDWSWSLRTSSKQKSSETSRGIKQVLSRFFFMLLSFQNQSLLSLPL